MGSLASFISRVIRSPKANLGLKGNVGIFKPGPDWLLD